MKILFLLASLFAAVHAQSIGVPTVGTTLIPGQNFVVQLINGIDTSNEAGELEVSLVIGIAPCGTGCPPPSATLGEILFIGKYQPQGLIGNDVTSFENFTFVVPNDLSGVASIQVQHQFLTTLPGDVSVPEVQYTSVPINIGNSGNTGSTLNIHPTSSAAKCVGIKGGVYANGTAVDVFDCNDSATQSWRWSGESLVSVNPVDQSQWCLDAGVESSWADGVQIKIWECFSGLPQQTWTPITTSGTIKLPSGNFCLDLTNGVLTNDNILQIWTCTANDANQAWTATSA